MRRILALDGGGVRGVFTLQILSRIEELFRLWRGQPDLVLRDEFDFFAGTSTGAIIATCLAWGMSVGEIERLYIDNARAMFAPAHWYSRWRAKYQADPIAALFRTLFSEDDHAGTPATLGTSRLWHRGELKYLLIVTRNASTGSPWPVSNNPNALYNDADRADCNLRIPIWVLLRASTAAPWYFAPQAIEIGGSRHVFIDGGMTPFNNPAMIAALTALLPCYRMNWSAGVDRLLVVSVGTGQTRTVFKSHDAERISVVEQFSGLAGALMGSISQHEDMMCRLLGRCRAGGVLDSEVGDLTEAALFSESEQKFSYVRYNREFTAAETAELYRLTRQKFALDNLRLIPFLQAAGREYAAAAVRADDLLLFPGAAASTEFSIIQ